MRNFKLIAGECAYIGREGIEFYPQELLIFTYAEKGPKAGTVFLENIQVQRSKYKIPRQKRPIETKYLFPLVKGPAIKPFQHSYAGLIVPFPYKREDPHRPIDAATLAKQSESPLLLGYFRIFEETIRAQTQFSDKIRGPDAGEFYGLARTGPYSFADVYVAYRDNTKWRATVVTSSVMPWGERKRFVFQNHAVSMCERQSGGFITEEEAHYICAIMNAPIVERFIYASSDERSFKIRPPVYIPEFDALDSRHTALAEMSMTAHQNPNKITEILQKIETTYLQICRDREKIEVEGDF